MSGSSVPSTSTTTWARTTCRRWVCGMVSKDIMMYECVYVCIAFYHCSFVELESNSHHFHILSCKQCQAPASRQHQQLPGHTPHAAGSSRTMQPSTSVAVRQSTEGRWWRNATGNARRTARACGKGRAAKIQSPTSYSFVSDVVLCYVHLRAKAYQLLTSNSNVRRGRLDHETVCTVEDSYRSSNNNRR